MKWKEDLVKDIRFNNNFDDSDDPIYGLHGGNYDHEEVTECNRSALLEYFLKVRDNCQAILEIGVGRNKEKSFATVFFDNKKEETVYIGIDIEDRSWLCECGENINTIEGDSSNFEEMVEIFEKHFSVKKFDFIFIDGWHSINQVLRDWEYTKLLSDKGIVGFHDTTAHPGPYYFVNNLDSNKWDVATNCCPDDNGIGFVWRK